MYMTGNYQVAISSKKKNGQGFSKYNQLVGGIRNLTGRDFFYRVMGT